MRQIFEIFGNVVATRFLVSPFIFVIIFNILTFTGNVSSLPCSYQVPQNDDLILNVPLSKEISHSKRGKRLVRQTTRDKNFQHLRIFLYFDQASINPLPVDKQIFINSSLLPNAIGFWEKALLIRRTHAPIRLSRKCRSNHYYLEASEPHPSCVDRCKEVTTCGEVAIPDEHLFQCRFCALPTPLACTSTGAPDGPGVTDADFVLYVSAVNSNRCKNEDTIAYAAHCQQEADLDRPIAGHVNICPSALSTHLHDQEILLSTVKHEILHALGFSAGLYAFFRDEHGNPRTKRNRYNRPLSFNRERGYYDADDSTVKIILRDWWTSEGTVPHPVHVMVTERVRDEVRKHFGCNVLEGAELENQGGDGTAFTHWEKRLFENEAMTGTHTQNPVYSRVTLALMEDSGWYKANYDIAEELHWGHKLGCNFSMKSCGEWIHQRLKAGLPLAPFCHDIKHDGKKSLATTRCTDQRDSLALCNLVPYKKPLPKDYRNFDHLDGVKKEGLKYYGGSVELADFCPYNQEFEWRSVNTSDRRDSRCELEGNFPGEYINSIMEIYGNSSKCFDLNTTWTEKKCGRVKNYSQYMAGCYGFVCLDGRLHLEVFNSSELYPCYHEGQNIHIKRIDNGWLREGSIICPSCNEMCNMHRQLGDEHFKCLPDTAPPNGYVGDPPLNEPCVASLNTPQSFIFIIFVVVLTRCMISLFFAESLVI